MKAKLVSTIENSRTYTLAVANAMPEKSLQFRPTPEVMTFLELVNHITYGIHWWNENYVRNAKTPWDPPTSPAGRTAVLKDLDEAFRALRETVESATLTEETTHGVYTTLDHVTHHRGQATTYLRANGVTPPEYTY